MFLRVPPWVAPLVLLFADQARAAPCREPADLRIWSSPAQPVAGAPLRLMAVGEAPAAATLAAGQPLATVTRGGPPPSWTAEISSPRAGSVRVELREGTRVLACRTIEVARKPAAAPAQTGSFWTATRAWDRASEDFYAAWVEALFDAPPTESLTFRPLTPAMRDPKRNFLLGHLGMREDDPKNKQAIPAEPDCADLPYFLRGYFAWKLGLPFGFRDCNRGSSTSPPRCGALITNADAPTAAAKTPLAVARQFFRKLANTAHSGSARTALTDEASDFYPVALTRGALRPGTVYADPYGHVLLLVKWVPPADGRGGLLLAVDGQPDGSIARKRFWEGTFLFASGVPSAGPGFKAFRPLTNEGPMANAALAGKNGVFAPFARDQESMNAEAFYARMGKLINPQGLPPQVAYEETLAALLEQMDTRIGSVENGEKYMRETAGAVIPMPDGPKIFETVGPWEDYATPSRDMRLIIAMNVLTSLPRRIVAHPELFVLNGRKPEEVRREVETLHAQRTKERSIEYKRSDGTPQRLTVAELLTRKTALEMSYNPNDCVERRWGAPEGSPEMATCTRRAPEDQRAKMEQYRAWFREARRPPR